MSSRARNCSELGGLLVKGGGGAEKGKKRGGGMEKEKKDRGKKENIHTRSKAASFLKRWELTSFATYPSNHQKSISIEVLTL